MLFLVLSWELVVHLESTSSLSAFPESIGRLCAVFSGLVLTVNDPASSLPALMEIPSGSGPQRLTRSSAFIGRPAVAVGMLLALMVRVVMEKWGEVQLEHLVSLCLQS